MRKTKAQVSVLRVANIFVWMFLGIGLIPSPTLAQMNNLKVGGICFRVDDIHPINNWIEYAKVFDKYRYHFTLALNLGLVDGIDDYFQLINNLQTSGHEFADHTPNHTTFSFTVHDTAGYAGKPGVDHISQNRIYLQYQPLDTSALHNGHAIVDIRNGFAYSRTPGAFANFADDGESLIGIYVPATGQLFGVGMVYADNLNDVDTLQLLSIWGEGIVIHGSGSVYCDFIGQYDIHVTNDGLSLLAQRTLLLSQEHGIQRPNVWIEPGGRFPTMNRIPVKQVYGNMYHYTAACSDPATSLKCFNEYDPNQDKRYSIEWGDFHEDTDDFQTLKSMIADKVAKHYFLVGHSHFNNLLGGWAGYLARMDSLLNWCKTNSQRIQVVTYSDMAHLLYDIPQNPYVNIIPPLNVDLDGNRIPDGYWISSVASLDTTDGVPSDGGYSLRTSNTGTICSITALAGLEKGDNDFNIWTKGAAGDSVSVTFSMQGYPDQVYIFPAANEQWTNYSVRQSANQDTALFIPPDVSTTDITVGCLHLKNGIVKIAGMSLRKRLTVPFMIISAPDTLIMTGTPYSARMQSANIYPGDIITYKMSVAPQWLQISVQGALSGTAPSTSGIFPVTIAASDQHGDSSLISFNLHVLKPDTSAIQIVSTPDTVMAPNAMYYYAVYANGSYLSDTLQYSKLSGPDWLSMSADGILSGTAPIVDSLRTSVTILVRDQHADADTQSFRLTVRPLALDDFDYSDTPLDHGWIATLSGGEVSVGFDSTIRSRTLNLSTSTDLDFGLTKYGRWLANSLTASVKSSSDFKMSVWAVDSKGAALYMQYLPGTGQPETGPGNTISFYLGNQFNNGSWQSLARNLNLDLRSIKWGANIRRMLGFSVNGSVEVGNLVVGEDVSFSEVKGAKPIVASYELEQNYPNPFNPTTTVDYYIGVPSFVVINIYNVLGQRVKTLFGDVEVQSGNHSVIWRGDDDSGRKVSSGVYFCRLEATALEGPGHYLAVKKMVLIK